MDDVFQICIEANLYAETNRQTHNEIPKLRELIQGESPVRDKSNNTEIHAE